MVLVFKAIHQNWDLMEPGDWNKTEWYIFSDRTVKKVIYINSDNESNEKSISNKESIKLGGLLYFILMKLIENSMKCKPKVVDAMDGDAWEFIKYSNGKIIWKKKLNYIYGIKKYELLANYLEIFL